MCFGVDFVFSIYIYIYIYIYIHHNSSHFCGLFGILLVCSGDVGGHVVVVLLVAASRDLSRKAISWHPPDGEVFHSRESCSHENFYVSHFVLPSDFHD